MKENIDEVVEVQEDKQVDEEKKWCVYMHTSPSGKRYIGITSKNPPELRWENGYGYRKHDRFWNAIELYKWKNFKHEILYDNLTMDEANKKEVELISLYKSNQREFGYNIEPGGGATYGMSEETKKKISIAHKGMHTGEKNYFYGVHMNGIDNPFYGKKHTEESREKMSMSRSGHKNWQCKAVYSPELDRIFWGAKAVEIEFGVGRSRITANCTGNDTYRVGVVIDGDRVLTTWMYAKDAVERNYIEQQRLDEYLNKLKKETEA